MKTFHQLIVDAREHAQLPQRTVAAQLGLHPSYVNHVEKGRRIPPRRELLDRWLDLLDASAADRYLICQSAESELAANALGLLDGLSSRGLMLKILGEVSLCRADDLERIERPLLSHLRHLLAATEITKQGEAKELHGEAA